MAGIGIGIGVGISGLTGEIPPVVPALNINYLLAEGDSITQDQYEVDDEGDISIIDAQNRYRDAGNSLYITSSGFPGATTADMLADTPANLTTYGDLIDTVLLQTGTNDILREPFGGTYSAVADAAGDYDGLRANLESMIDLYLNAGWTVIPVSFPCRQPDIGAPLYDDQMGPWLENIYHPIYAAKLPDWCSGGKPLINLYELSKTFPANPTYFFDDTHFTTLANRLFKDHTLSVLSPQLPSVADAYAPLLSNAASSSIDTGFTFPAVTTASNDYELTYHIRRGIGGTQNLWNCGGVIQMGLAGGTSEFGRLAGGGNSTFGNATGKTQDLDVSIVARYTNATDNMKIYVNGRLTVDTTKTRGTNAVDALLSFGKSGIAGGDYDGIIYGCKVHDLTTDTVLFSEEMVSGSAASLPVGDTHSLTYNNRTASDNLQVMRPAL